MNIFCKNWNLPCWTTNFLKYWSNSEKVVQIANFLFKKKPFNEIFKVLNILTLKAVDGYHYLCMINKNVSLCRKINFVVTAILDLYVYTLSNVITIQTIFIKKKDYIRSQEICISLFSHCQRLSGYATSKMKWCNLVIITFIS